MNIHKHLNRAELLALAREGDSDNRLHLRQCSDCREIVETLKKYYMVGSAPFPEPPDSWIDEIVAKTHGAGLFARASKIVATLIWDSWAQPQPVGIRSTGTAQHRRCTFTSPQDITLDLRVEKRSGAWTCVAEIAGATKERASLLVDGSEIVCGRSGLYTWERARPPKSMAIRLDTTTIYLPGLSWRRTRT